VARPAGAAAPAPDTAGIEIRPLAGPHDHAACVALQREVWGADFQEVVPPTILWLANRIGGVAAGAFDGGRLAGFVVGLTGVEDGRLVHWSDMLAVAAGYRGRGLGRRLKEYQRALLLPRGVDIVYWTFDPLEGRNAHLNLARLGAIARSYVRDLYGPGTSPLHAGVGTDRLVAEWWIRSDRVERRLSSPPRPPRAAAAAAPAALDAGDSPPRPGDPVPDLVADRVRVAVPMDLQALKRADPDLAARWRSAARAALEGYLARDYRVVDFVRGAETGDYVLARAGTPDV
jgi:predicted GNAT superfamily acetyltransferase